MWVDRSQKQNPKRRSQPTLRHGRRLEAAGTDWEDNLSNIVLVQGRAKTGGSYYLVSHGYQWRGMRKRRKKASRMGSVTQYLVLTQCEYSSHLSFQHMAGAYGRKVEGYHDTRHKVRTRMGIHDVHHHLLTQRERGMNWHLQFCMLLFRVGGGVVVNW